METETRTYYTWEVPGKRLSIRLGLDVVDQILTQVLRGFGAVPRRGVEVGGILLGSIERGTQTVVHIEGFEPAPCQHAKGPSFLLSDTDREGLEAALRRLSAAAMADGREVVGVYRSHTREGLSLSAEDLALFEEYFPSSDHVFLLVKPFATRASVGAFFFREDGAVRSDSSYREFPFRRRELAGETPAPEDGETPPPSLRAVPLPERRPEKRNLWIPLSFIFLLVGVVLGFQTALTLRPAGASSVTRDPLVLSLTAVRSGDAIQLRWDRQSPAIQRSRGGTLTINDGAHGKTLDLDPTQLLYGTVFYRNLTDRVNFRLEVRSSGGSALVETLEFHTEPPGAEETAAPAGSKKR